MADEPVIANSSPLILLSRAGHFHLLRAMGDVIHVPRVVVAEIRHRGDADPTASAIISSDWIRIVDAPAVPATVAGWNLGAGESAVLSYASAHPGSLSLLDDLAARRCAKSLNLKVRGTLAVVAAAKRKNMIPLAAPVVQSLQVSGMYVSARLIREVLSVLGE